MVSHTQHNFGSSELRKHENKCLLVVPSGIALYLNAKGE
jgi:hypothetical protein